MSIRTLLYTESRLQGIPWTTVCRRAGVSRQVADYQLTRRKPGPTLDLSIADLSRRSGAMRCFPRRGAQRAGLCRQHRRTQKDDGSTHG